MYVYVFVYTNTRVEGLTHGHFILRLLLWPPLLPRLSPEPSVPSWLWPGPQHPAFSSCPSGVSFQLAPLCGFPFLFANVFLNQIMDDKQCSRFSLILVMNQALRLLLLLSPGGCSYSFLPLLDSLRLPSLNV